MIARRFILFCLFAFLLSFALTSCKVGPDYRRPEQRMPTTYKNAATQPTTQAATGPTTEPTITADWWKLFNDPQLTALEEEASRTNFDLQAAMARVEQARQAAKIVGSQFYPTVTFNPSIERARTPRNTSLNTGGSKGVTQTTTQIPFDLSYELDVWGRVRRAYEAARAQYQASADDYHVVLQTLQADVASDYYSLRSLDAQAKILNRTVNSYREQLALTQTQFKAGIVGPTDVAQSQSVLNSTSALEVDARRQRADTEHALAILLGRAPSELTMPEDPLADTPPLIPTSLPADLLRHRPDIAEAEQNLIAANAQIGVAKALFYPTISLTGAAGFESFDVEHSLDWQNRIWAIGAGAAMPIFEGGRIKANLEQTKARYAELTANYRTAVLGAIRDVEDSLTDLHLRADEADLLATAVKASRQYVDLSRTQYTQGLVSYLQVIDAERTLLANELTAQQTLNQRMISTVLLIKALGGGWDPDAAAVNTDQRAH